MYNFRFGDLIVQEHSGFIVVRGDLYPGGIKARCLLELMSEIDKDEIVYAAHPYGHSGLALGLTGLYNNKKITLFFAGREVDSYILDQTRSLNNVRCIFVDSCIHQSQLIETAKKYARDNYAYYMPIGFNFKAFNDRLIQEARSLKITPAEVWVAAGSGTTARCLARAWPDAKLNVVNLGMMPSLEVEANDIFLAPENPNKEAELPPPYPAASYYDAKIWRFVKAHATKGALIWNIA
jgi:hypothetical protein